MEEIRQSSKKDLLRKLESILKHGMPVTDGVLSWLLQGNSRDPREGRSVHAMMLLSHGTDSLHTLADHIIRLFASCGCLLEANLVFCKVSAPSLCTWHAIISAHANCGESGRVFDLFYQMQYEGFSPNRFIFVCVLKACHCVTSIKTMHSQIVGTGLDLDVVVGSTLIYMYTKLGNLKEGQKVFDGLQNPDVVSWGTMISGYVQHGYGQLALELFDKMQGEGIQPDKLRFLSVLRACGSIASLVHGSLVHSQIIESGLDLQVEIVCSLVDMYAKCACLPEARQMFDAVVDRDFVLWGVIISGYAQHGQDLDALDCFERMQQENIKPSKVIYVCVLKLCSNEEFLILGRLIHLDILADGVDLDVNIVIILIDMYARCGSLNEAQRLFERLPTQNSMTWSAIIMAYTHQEEDLTSLKLFDKMQQEGIDPNQSILMCVLKACNNTRALELGKLVHDQLLRSMIELPVILGSMVVDMYAKCGCLECARATFDRLPSQDLVSWGAVVDGYAQQGHVGLALEILERMHTERINPDQAIYISILKACSRVQALVEGKLIHDQIIRCDIQHDASVSNTLMDMYVKCGSLEEARQVFNRTCNKDVVSWSVMIAGYVQDAQDHHALELVEKMLEAGVDLDKVVFLCILKACGRLKALRCGRQSHKLIVTFELELDLAIGSSLIEMYVDCGSLEEAHKVFNLSPNRDLVTWGVMIAGYVEQGNGFLGLKLYEQMQQHGIIPNEIVCVHALKACSSVGMLRLGKLIHDYANQLGLDSDAVLVSALLDMYGKCGSVKEAKNVFAHLPQHDEVSWGALIEGYVRNGYYDLALNCLREMQVQGLKPHSVIYLSILSACSHGGMVQEGKQCFKAMIVDHAIEPGVEHLNCMIDLFSRTGGLEEAAHFLQSLPVPPDNISWNSLLTSCETHGSIKLGRECFDQVSQLDPNKAAGYVTMSNLYGDAQMYKDIDQVQVLKRNAAAWKIPGKAWIDVGDCIHEFIVGDKLQNEEVHNDALRVTKILKEDGLVPDLELKVEI